MEIEDLMAGDYVYNDKKQICKVCSINAIGIPYAEADNLAIDDGCFTLLYDYSGIPLTPEILEKNGFKKDAFTNLSMDYYFNNNEYSICINLNSTCDKSKSVWIEKRSSRFTVSIEESRHSLDKKPLYVHQLQNALRLCGINKEIKL